MPTTRFHLAVSVDDMSAARAFYRSMLGCAEGRSDARWVDFDFFGHQLTVHLDASGSRDRLANPVDGDEVPVPHFGVILPWEAWERLGAHLKEHGVATLIGPRVRFRGEKGEQGTFFVRDPAGNALEFKSFREDSQVFARDC